MRPWATAPASRVGHSGRAGQRGGDGGGVGWGVCLCLCAYASVRAGDTGASTPCRACSSPGCVPIFDAPQMQRWSVWTNTVCPSGAARVARYACLFACLPPACLLAYTAALEQLVTPMLPVRGAMPAVCNANCPPARHSSCALGAWLECAQATASRDMQVRSPGV